MRKILSVIRATLYTLCLIALGACSCNNGKGKESREKEKLEPKTVEVQILGSMPVKGRDAEYISFTGPEGTSTLVLNGKQDESSKYFVEGIVRTEIEMKINKPFPDKIHDFAGYPKWVMRVLDEDMEELATLEMSKTEMDIIKSELEKAEPGTLKIVYKDDMRADDYNELFAKAKYVFIEGVEIQGEKEYAETRKPKKDKSTTEPTEDTSVKESRKTSSKSVSKDDDDEEYDESAEKLKSVKQKAKDKYKKIKDKTLDKLNEWLD